jgi:branched-chain amino acid transport system ATP-binding protein
MGGRGMMLELEAVTVGYSALPVLREVSIRVPAGQLVAVVGPNGAGKSTLFKTVSGMLKTTSGAIRFEGVDIGDIAPARRPHLGIAHVPEGRQVFPSLTVMENLETGATTAAGRRDWKVNLEKILHWLPRLAERRDQMAGTLSGGEQQMLAIGRGLASSPKLLMLDEPSMGLAPILVDEVFRIIERLKGQGVTMLLVEQFAAAALAVADYGYVLENGKINVHGPADKLRNDPAVKAAYLGGGH